MTNAKAPRDNPLQSRVTREERDLITQGAEALGMTVSHFLKWCALTYLKANPPKARNRNPVKNHTALLQVLAWFGSTRIPNNLNQLAKAANSGALPVTPDTEALLQRVCLEILEVCRLIRKALGFAVEDDA